MNVLKISFTFFALFLNLAGWSQQTSTTITLINESINKRGKDIYKETHLKGAKAERFNWQDHTGDFTDIRIFTEVKTEVNDGLQQRKKVIPLPDDHLLIHIHRVLTTDDEGTKREYLRNQGEDLPEGTAITSGNFWLSDQSQSDGFPSLYIEETDESWYGKFRLIWVGTGECPEEIGEENLLTDTLRVLLQDEDWNTLMSRDITSRVIPQASGKTTRIVEIREETFIPSQK